MPQSTGSDHDQRLKVLLKEFFEQFFLCFFPTWAERFEFFEIDWLDKAARDTGLPVLPIALLLRVGLDGIGWDAYEEHFWDQRIVRFEYAYVGLPALDAAPYATGENLLGVALSALMRQPAERRAELYAEGLKRIAASEENDFRRFLLAECLEAYAELDETEKQRLGTLLQTEAYHEVEPLMKTTYERGIEQGIEQGERRLTLRLLDAKFGPLTPKVKQQVESLSLEALTQLQLDLLKAQTLEELRLE